MFAANTGNYNIAVGGSSLAANTGGEWNTALAKNALLSNTTGNYNVAVGGQALNSNTTANNNTAVGYQAAYSNTTGQYHTAVGMQAMYSVSGGDYNTAIGYHSLYSSTTGSVNTSVGMQALFANTTGNYNTTLGHYALGSNTTASYNTAVGYSAGSSITTGAKNTIIGSYNGNQGGLDIRTSSNNIVLSDGDGNPRLHCNSSGAWSGPQEFTQARGDAGFGFISDSTSGAGSGIVNYYSSMTSASNNTNCAHFRATTQGVSTWQLFGNGTSSFSSDERLKKNIETTRDGYLDDLAQLRVVKYNWHSDEDGTPKELGLIAQEVEQVFAGLVHTESEAIGDVADPKAIKTSVLPFMLLKALQEANDEIKSLKSRIEALETN